MADRFTAEERSRIMAAVKSTGTTPELRVRRMAHALGYRYRLHVRMIDGTPDLVFPRLRKIIDVRGCFWHGHSCGRCRIPRTRRAFWRAKIERNQARDRRTIRRQRRAGWGVMIVWECQTVAGRADALRRRIARFLDED